MEKIFFLHWILHSLLNLDKISIHNVSLPRVPPSANSSHSFFHSLSTFSLSHENHLTRISLTFHIHSSLSQNHSATSHSLTNLRKITKISQILSQTSPSHDPLSDSLSTPNLHRNPQNPPPSSSSSLLTFPHGHHRTPNLLPPSNP